MVQLKKLNILFLEDNQEFAKNTIEFLELYFNKIFHTTTVEEALALYSDSRVDVIISDIKVDDGNGLDFIQAVRKKDLKTPIFVISAHKDIEFLFQAIPLKISAYEIKPLSYDDMQNLLKSIKKEFVGKEKVAINKELQYCYDLKELYEDNQAITLTNKERLFIELLLQNTNKILTNEVIQKDIWEEKIMSLAAIKNFILRLRKKVNSNFITTIKGIGYRITTN